MASCEGPRLKCLCGQDSDHPPTEIGRRKKAECRRPFRRMPHKKKTHKRKNYHSLPLSPRLLMQYVGELRCNMHLSVSLTITDSLWAH